MLTTLTPLTPTALITGEPVLVTERVPGVEVVFRREPGWVEPYRYRSNGPSAVIDAAALAHDVTEQLDLFTRLFRGPDGDGEELASVELHCTLVTDPRYGGSPGTPALVLTDVRLDEDWMPVESVFGMGQLFELATEPVLFTGPYAFEVVDAIVRGPGLFGGPIEHGVLVEPQRSRLEEAGQRAKYLHTKEGA